MFKFIISVFILCCLAANVFGQEGSGTVVEIIYCNSTLSDTVAYTFSGCTDNNVLQEDETCTGTCADGYSADQYKFTVVCQDDGEFYLYDSATETSTLFSEATVCPEDDPDTGVDTTEITTMAVTMTIATDVTVAAGLQDAFEDWVVEDIATFCETDVDLTQYVQFSYEIAGESPQIILEDNEYFTKEEMTDCLEEAVESTNSQLRSGELVSDETSFSAAIAAECWDGTYQSPCPQEPNLPDADDNDNSSSNFWTIVLVIMAVGGVGIVCYAKSKHDDQSPYKDEEVEMDFTNASSAVPVPQFLEGGNDGFDESDDESIRVTVG